MQEIGKRSRNNNQNFGLKAKHSNKVQVPASKINTLFGYANPTLRKYTHIQLNLASKTSLKFLI